MFEKKKVLSTLKEIVISGIVAFVLYLFIMYFIAYALMESATREMRSAVGYVLMLLLFTFSYGFVHMRAIKNDYVLDMKADEPFDFKGEYIGFLKNEGKLLLALMAVLACVSEASLWIWPLISTQPGNPIYTVLSPVFMIGALIENVPIIRSILPIALNIPLMALFTVLRKKKIYKEYKKEQ